MCSEVDAYIANLARADHRAALTALRQQLRALLPDHTEVISYKMPGFRAPSGAMTAGYASFARHCGYYPHSGQIIAQFPAECAPFKSTKGALQFTPEHPLPADLVAKLVAARLSEIATRGR
jgi:uncharacterized protein YdhG (YjbR/CyaY superfamily)